MPVSFRTGIALYPADGAEAGALFRNAEAALRTALSASEAYAFYSPQITATMAQRAALEPRLRRAVDRNEFTLHYQPNVSAVQLRQLGFVDSVAQLLQGEVGPEARELEITESMLMEDLEGTVRALRSLSDLGVHIAIDDFGRGYSSLRYLAKLPIGTVKVDRSFISAMTADPDSMTIVATIISLAHSLKMSVCGEGVESEEHSRVLAVLRCDTMQGYLFSRPVSAAQIAEQLRRAALPRQERAR